MFFRPRATSGNDHHAGFADLQDIGQRSLIRMIFAATGLTLWVFCALQFMAHNYLLASFELTPAQDLAAELEQLGKDGDLGRAEALLAQLQEQVEVFLPLLARHLAQHILDKQ